MTSPRKNIMLGTAGHVDHGKTALVKLLTGCDTDRLAVEKQRGLTIELGFAPCAMADERIVGIVDVPGHVDFIRNMAAGVHGIDVVILVVAADDGVMPQTREHLDILTLMGVRRGLVALTKIDVVDESLREMAVEDVRNLLDGTFLADAPICPVSNITGEGFDGFLSALNEAVAACRPREYSGLFRMWVERSFTAAGFGTVASGIPTSGEVRVGDRLTLVPGPAVGRVRGLEVYGQQAQLGRAGECVAINLTDVGRDQLGRGKLLCQGDAFQPVSMVEAELRLLAGVPRALPDYAEVHVHVGTADVPANVALLEGKPLEPGGRQFVQLRLHRAMGVAPGDRFVIRTSVSGLAGGRMTTVGGGRVLGTSDRRLRRNRPWTLADLSRRRDAIDEPAAWCAVHLREAGMPLKAAELARRVRVPPERAATLLDELIAEGTALDAGDGAVVHREVVGDLARRAVEALEEFHGANPTRAGMERAELLERLGADDTLLPLALAGLADQGAVQQQGELVSLPGRGAVISAEDRQLCDRIEAVLRRRGLEGPSPDELAGEAGVPPDRLDDLVRILQDRGAVLTLNPRLRMHCQAVEAAKQVVLDLFETHSRFETTEFRDALGVSRKYAVPLLDYFDTVRLTVRSGSRRSPGVEAKRILAERGRGACEPPQKG